MNNMQLWLISSTDSINLNSAADGYYLNPDLDGLTGLPGIRSSNGVNAGYDGGWTSTQLWDARLITIRGLIVDKDGSQVELKRKALSKLVGQGKKEPLTLKFVTEFGRTYTCTVRTTNCTMALQNIFTRQEYQIQLRADDPLIYDDGGNDVKATLRVTEDNVGFEIPFDIPLDISGGADPVVVDAGEDTNYPLITMYGELHSPTIVNQTTNQQLQLGADLNGLIRDWNETDTASGNPLQITNSTEYDAPILDFKLNGNTEQTSLLPDIYQAVQYIESTGAQYIDTGLKFGAFDKIETRFEEASYYSSYPKLYGLESGSNTEALKLDIRNGTWRIGINNVESQIGNYALNTIYTHILEYTSNSYFYAYMDGVEVLERTSNTTVSTAYNMFIFASNRAGNATENSAVKLYTFKMYKSGALVRNFIPCYRKSDGVVGLYDIIGKTFYTNASSSTTPFAKGGDMTLPTPDFPMPISTVSGEQVVKVEGKNLFPNITWTARVAYPVAQSGGISWWDGYYGFQDYVSVLPSTTYTFSNAENKGFYYGLQYYDENKTWISGTNSSTKTFTTPANCRYIRGSIQASSAPTNCQLELGSTATTYEAFRGTDYEVNLGKNLFDASTATIVNKYANTNGSMASASDWTGTDSYFEVQPNTTYTFSATNQGSRFLWNEYTTNDVSGFVSPRHESTGTFTTGATTHYVRFSTNSSNATNIQIELGSTATTYAPYFTPIELCKIGTYQDYIWNDNGTWKVHKAVGKVVLDGTETWTLNESGTGYVRFTTVQSGLITSFSNSQIYTMSDKFTASTQTETVNANADANRVCVVSNGRLLFKTLDTSLNTVAKWQTWLGTHNTTVYYVLATPTDTAITESALITQLNAIVQASLPVGLNNVSNISIAPNLAGGMVLTYGTGYIETPPDVAVIDCKDRTVSINGVNAFNLLADGSEFIRLEPGENKLYLTSETQSDSGYAEVKFKTGNLSI